MNTDKCLVPSREAVSEQYTQFTVWVLQHRVGSFSTTHCQNHLKMLPYVAYCQCELPEAEKDESWCSQLWCLRRLAGAEMHMLSYACFLGSITEVDVFMMCLLMFLTTSSIECHFWIKSIIQQCGIGSSMVTGFELGSQQHDAQSKSWEGRGTNSSQTWRIERCHILSTSFHIFPL